MHSGFYVPGVLQSISEEKSSSNESMDFWIGKESNYVSLCCRSRRWVINSRAQHLDKVDVRKLYNNSVSFHRDDATTMTTFFCAAFI